jgi:hypothetical protein
VRDARKRGELARCPAPSSGARGLCDSLDAPTKRHEMFPAYQSGRVFDEELIRQLNVLPDFVAAFGFANAKAPEFEAAIFSPPQSPMRSAQAGPRW